MRKIKYYYKTTNEPQIYHRRILQNEICHIAKNDDESFLCDEMPDGNFFAREANALPGIKLCQECIEERKRFMNKQPTSKQMSIWWQGGIASHRKEFEELK